MTRILKANRIALVVAYVVLSAGTVAALLPQLWMVACSFKPGGEIFSPPKSVIEARKADPNGHPGLLRMTADLLTPEKPTTSNYRRLFTEVPFAQFFVNSLFVSTASTLLTLFFCTLGGYAFAKYQFPGRGPLFTILLGSMMIPFQVLLVPLFALLGALHWFDNYAGIIVPFCASAFGVFLLRQYCQTVPDQLLDAARIDGAGEFGIYWSVVLPVVRPAIGALAIFTFMNDWNNYLWPLVVLRSNANYTLPLGLAGLVGVYSQEYGMLMAGSLLSTFPIILLFLWMQKEFVSGITLGAVKE